MYKYNIKYVLNICHRKKKKKTDIIYTKNIHETLSFILKLRHSDNLDNESLLCLRI